MQKSEMIKLNVGESFRKVWMQFQVNLHTIVGVSYHLQNLCSDWLVKTYKSSTLILHHDTYSSEIKVIAYFTPKFQSEVNIKARFTQTINLKWTSKHSRSRL